MTALAIDIRPEVDHVLVALRGELDIATIAELRQCMADVRRHGSSTVVIDASDLTFVSVRGMRALVAEMHALRHSRREVSIVNVRPQLRRLAKLLFAQAQLGLAAG